MRALHRPHVEVFAVDHESAQVVWRHLRPGRLVLDAPGTAPVEIDTEADGSDVAGAATVSGLAPAGETPITARGSAVPHPITVTARTLDRPPGPELTRLATVGDLHLGARAFGHWGTIVEDPEPVVRHPVRCATAALRRAVDWGARSVVVKGDATNNGQVEQWRSFADLVADVPAPVWAVPGNHDRAFRQGTGGLSPEDAAAVFGLRIASPMLVDDLPGVRVVAVDSTSGGRNPGRISGVRDALVDAVAETPAGSAALVLMHHQLHQHPVQEGWPVGVDRRATLDLLDRLAATGTPTLVSSGHTHRHRRWSHGPVTVTQVGSTKDHPGTWAGYVAYEGGLRQVVRRVDAPDCLAWTDRTRRAAGGLWRWIGPGSLPDRCFDLTW